MQIVQPREQDLIDYEGANGAYWQTMRDWMSYASHAIRQSPEMLTRADMTLIKRWLHLLETMLRRLVLLAAIDYKVDIVPRWSRPTRKKKTAQPKPKPRRKPRPDKPTFKLFSVRWPKPAPRPRIMLLDAPPPPKPKRCFIITRPFITWQSDTLLQAGAKPERAKTKRQPATRRRSDLPPTRRERIEGNLLPSGQKQILCPNRAKRTAGLPPGISPKSPTLAIETKSEPETIAREVMVERFLALVKLIAKSQPLIRRAAFAMARCRELAMRLGYADPPRPRGRMHLAVREYSTTLIPLHQFSSNALMNFAASYTEPDSS